MKYIKFTMSKGDEITVSFEKAERLLASPDQLVKITDENGEWTGEVLNKAHIVSSKRDFMKEKEKTDDDRFEEEKRLLPSASLKIVDTEKFKPEFLRKPYKDDDSEEPIY